jgi:hypothetical protein
MAIGSQKFIVGSEQTTDSVIDYLADPQAPRRLLHRGRLGVMLWLATRAGGGCSAWAARSCWAGRDADAAGGQAPGHRRAVRRWAVGGPPSGGGRVLGSRGRGAGGEQDK